MRQTRVPRAGIVAVMVDGAEVIDTDVFTLLGVRRDGVASVVDLVADGVGAARRRAYALLKEHASCEAVEVWHGGGLMETVVRN
jgi:hypothetical protein